MAGDQGRAPRADRGAHRLRQDARRLSRGDRRAGAPGARGRAARRDAGGLRLAAQGAVERHPEEPRGAARRHPRGARGARPARRRHPHLGAHRRYAGGRARPHAPPPAAHRRDHAGIALHPARLGIGPRDARHHPDGDRRRDPRGGAEQARVAPRRLARAARRLVRPPGAAHRPVGDAEADRGGGALPGRSRAGRRQGQRLHHHRYRPSPAARPRARSARLAARSRDVGRGLGAGL